MKRTGHSMQPPRTEAIEALLRSAAEYEPAEQAPADLVAQAFRAWETRRVEDQRRQRLGVVSGLMIACGILAAVFSTGLGRLMRDRGPGASYLATADVGKAITDYRPQQAPAREHVDDPSSEPTLGAVQLISQKSWTPSSSRRRMRRSVLRARPARWDVEVVERQVTGVVLPTWLVEEDGTTGELLASPALVDIPLASGTYALRPSEHPDRASDMPVENNHERK